jgi:predicted ATP-grasp superfamily ATP-dependent carboligase
VEASGTVLIFGASARAAAFSALRAGLRPWCADLFADADLRQRVPAMQLPARYPDGFLDLIDVELPGPWMYTGGLENRPFLVRKMARRRPLWGNDRAALLDARSPFRVGQLLRKADLPGPSLWGAGDAFRPAAGRRWLVKPLAGSGGAGIHFLDPAAVGSSLRADRCYLQEYLEGESRSAVFLGDGRTARLLGVTEQLVGSRWLNALPFHYCGSIGPLPPTPAEAATVERLGNVLAAGCGLRGLFGVDGIWRRGSLWPVEVNPRYTASVEVLEYATGLPALTWHARAFATGGQPPDAVPAAADVVGKAVLFARRPIVFPAEGTWTATLASPPPVQELPAFADVPPAGTPIGAGQPVLTVFARAASVPACTARLQEAAAELDRLLFGPRTDPLEQST